MPPIANNSPVSRRKSGTTELSSRDERNKPSHKSFPSFPPLLLQRERSQKTLSRRERGGGEGSFRDNFEPYGRVYLSGNDGHHRRNRHNLHDRSDDPWPRIRLLFAHT